MNRCSSSTGVGAISRRAGVCLPQRGVLGHACEPGVQRLAPGTDGPAPLARLDQLRLHLPQLAAQFGDTGARHLLAGALAHVRGGGLGPASGQRARTEPTVGADPRSTIPLHPRRVRPVEPAPHSAEVGHRRLDAGRPTALTDPLGHTTRYGWTIEGKPAWRENPDGTRETWEWDGEGSLVTHTDAAGHTTSHTHTHFDLPATRTDPDGAEYTFTYNTELRLTTVTNPQGRSWHYEYDPAGRLIAETDFNGATRTYELDAAGGLVARTNATGERLTYTRDPLGRPVEQRDETCGEVTTYTYDAAGALIRTANSAAEVTLERDALGRVLAETVNGRTTSYTYDTAGRRTSRTTPSGHTSTWEYDTADRPLSLTTDGGSLSFTHDAAGRETHRELTESVTLTQDWDTTGRLTRQTIEAADGELLQHRSYAYRPDGYVTEIRELTSGTRRFDLDTMGRVTGVQAHGWTERYAYDAVGNQSHADAPAHSSPGDRAHDGTLIRRAGRTTYEHDAAGRLIRKTRKLLNGQTRTWTYTWNAEDRLISATNPQGEEWHYTYDPLGRRISKTGPEDRAMTFTWDGTRLTEQINPDGGTTTWDYAPGTHRPLAQTDRDPLLKSPEFHAILTDTVGTPTDLISTEGHVAWQHRTTLWGTPLPAPPHKVDCPLRFPGQYADPETGLHYNYFRYYDPETARYLTPDPLGLVPAPHHHSYVHNPLTWLDPFGLQGCGIDDDTYDALDEEYGNRVADGVDHDFQRMNDGSPSAPVHSISGIGSDAQKLAKYLSSYEGKMTHTDVKTGSQVAYDGSRRDANGDGVLIVQTPYRIHAYHMPESSFNSGRYQSN